MRVGPGSAAYVDPAPHEVSGNLIYGVDGYSNEALLPYYALHRETRGSDYGEPVTGEFPLAGERWTSRLKPKGSGLAPWESPDFEIENVKEYSVKAKPANADERTAPPSVTFTVKPRWPDMFDTDGEPVNTPDLSGVNVRFDGSNLELDTYPVILKRAMGAVGIRESHFETIHPASNVWRYEAYLRLLGEKAKAVIGRGGTLEKIFELVGTGDGSFRELREDDGKIEGYHHRVTFDSAGAAELIEGHTLGKQIKHYHPKHVRSPGSDDPLAHPKIGVCYLSRRTDGGAVKWGDRDELEREVDETLVNAVGWSGLPTRADRSVYVEDAHFSVTESERELEVIDDPLPEIRRTQHRDMFVPGLSRNPDLNESALNAVEVMADGGREMTVDELAEEVDRSPRSIRRYVAERVCEILEIDNGRVEFVSSYLRDLSREWLSDPEGTSATEDDAADDGGVWARFLNRYGVEVVDRDDARLELRIGTLRGKDPRDVLADARGAWIRAGRDLARFRNGLLRVPDEGGSGYYDGIR